MKILKYNIVCLIFLCLALNGFAQDSNVNPVLKKVQDFYQDKAIYKLDLSFKMYQGITGDNITESYEGTMIKKENRVHLDMANSEMLSVGEDQVVVDHDQKLMILKKIPANQVIDPIIGLKSFMEFYEVSEISKNENQIRCELIAKKNKISVPYVKILLFINDRTYEIEKQEMIFAGQLPFKNKEGEVTTDFGRMVIEMKLDDCKDDTIDLSFDQYYLKNSTGTIEVQKQFEGYQFRDETRMD